MTASQQPTGHHKADALLATCPEPGCGWTMPADDTDEAETLLAVHRIVKWEQQREATDAS